MRLKTYHFLIKVFDKLLLIVGFCSVFLEFGYWLAIRNVYIYKEYIIWRPGGKSDLSSNFATLLCRQKTNLKLKYNTIRDI